jgi:hypothetical protein
MLSTSTRRHGDAVVMAWSEGEAAAISRRDAWKWERKTLLNRHASLFQASRLAGDQAGRWACPAFRMPKEPRRFTARCRSIRIRAKFRIP